MFSYIEGKVVDKEEGFVVIDCNGIGYEIQVSSHTLNSIAYLNENVKIYTYLQVKEDGISLYGFISKEEKNMFLKLISVNGIGPKMAIGILSGISINELISAIIRQDIKMLCTIKGLGKKTAERLLVDLKDKNLPVETTFEDDNLNKNFIEEATEALISLGVGKNEAYRLAKENASETTSVEEIITKALRGMGN